MSNLNSLLESSASGWKNMQNESAAMANKWGKTGLLEGISSEVDKNSMAMILENQAKQLVVEASANTTGTGFGPAGTVFSDPASLYGDTDPSGKGDPTGGLYGAGRFAYSTQQTSSAVSANASGSATWAQLNFEADKSASMAAGDTFSFITVPGPTRFDKKGVRAFTLNSGSSRQCSFYSRNQC